MTGPGRGAALAAAGILLNALVWGLSWWPLRRLESAGLHPLWSTFLIYLLGALIALGFARGSWRMLVTTPGLWLLALGSGLTNVGFNWAVTVGDVVRVVLLFYLMPAWSMLLAWPILGERPHAFGVARLVLGLAGMLIVLAPADGAWSLMLRGLSAADGLSLLGGASFGLTTVMLRRMAHTPSGARMLAMFGGGALLSGLAGLAGGAVGLVAAPPAPAAGWVLTAGLLAAAFISSNLTMQYGAARLAASSTALLMLTEVLFASASSVWLGAAVLTPQLWMGGALIVLAALLGVVGPGRTADAATPHA